MAIIIVIAIINLINIGTRMLRMSKIVSWANVGSMLRCPST